MKFYHFFYLFPAFIGNLCLASLSYTFSVHPEGAGIISYDSYENCLDVVGNECELVESLVAASNNGYRFSHFLIDGVKIYGEPPLNTIYYFPEGEFNSVNGIYDQAEEFLTCFKMTE